MKRAEKKTVATALPLARAPRRYVLGAAALAVVFTVAAAFSAACSINPQPLPPIDGENGDMGGASVASGSDAGSASMLGDASLGATPTNGDADGGTGDGGDAGQADAETPDAADRDAGNGDASRPSDAGEGDGG